MDCADGLGTNFTIQPNTLSVFEQDWWLEIARRDEATCHTARVILDGTTVAFLRYDVITDRFCASRSRRSDWSHIYGVPYLAVNLLESQKAPVLRQLIQQLPSNVSFCFICHPCMQDAILIEQAFKDAGFALSTQTIYLQYPEEALTMDKRLGHKSRYKIRQAQRELNFLDIDPDTFINFYQENLESIGKRSYYPLITARNLIAAGMGRPSPQVRIFAVGKKDNHSQNGSPLLDAAIACAYDDARYYYWMSTRRHSRNDSGEDKPNPHAVKLLLATAMRDAAERGLIFDADGVYDATAITTA
jgi:hypothetical protein